MAARTIFISTGEVSGDLQGALLVEALYRQADQLGISLKVVALGGARMAAAGAELLGDTTAIGAVGLWESVRFVRPTQRVQDQAKAYLKSHPPDLAVLIDYMGPNLVLGNYLRRHWASVPIAFYIAPQVWVWSPFPNDAQRIINVADQILAIFPEEARYFAAKGANVSWVGHPLVDRVRDFPPRLAARADLGIGDQEIAIALLPASRQQELQYLMPVMFAAAQGLQTQYPQASFWIPVSLPKYKEAIAQAAHNYGLKAHVITESPEQVLAAADLALTKSGTVNLELALLGVPQVVIYRLSRLTAWIAKYLLRFSIPFMSPPNLVAMREIVPEFLQDRATPANIIQAAREFLDQPQRLEQLRHDYQQMRGLLGEDGVSDRTAQKILQMLPEKS